MSEYSSVSYSEAGAGRASNLADLGRRIAEAIQADLLQAGTIGHIACGVFGGVQRGRCFRRQLKRSVCYTYHCTAST